MYKGTSIKDRGFGMVLGVRLGATVVLLISAGGMSLSVQLPSAFSSMSDSIFFMGEGILRRLLFRPKKHASEGINPMFSRGMTGGEHDAI